VHEKTGDPKSVGGSEVSESDEVEWCTTYPSAPEAMPKKRVIPNQLVIMIFI
jgi:hypothetical protein